MALDAPVALVLAAGVGSRVGADLPKQFLDLHGRAVIAWTVSALAWCARVVVVHHPEHVERTRQALVGACDADVLVLTPGGATRRASVAAALAAVEDLADDVPVVLQNAASPNTPRTLVERCVEALDTHDAVQAYVPAVHTVFKHAGGELAEVLPRAELGYSADPSVYRLGRLREVVAAQSDDRGAGEMTLDTALNLGMRVRLVPSPDTNVKLTARSDLVLLQALLGTG